MSVHRQRAPKARARQLDPHTKDGRELLEVIARLLVPSSYRVPVEGRSSRPGMQPSDIAGAVGYVRDRVGKRAALAVARRAERPEIARLAADAYRRVLRQVVLQRSRPLDLHLGEDRWRLRQVVYDAAYELVWPERRRPFAVLAKATKMRKSNYIDVHRCATAVLQEAMADASRELGYRLFGNG